MQIGYDDGRERLRERIPAPSSGEAVAYAVVATVLGFLGGFAAWAYTGEVAALPGVAAATGGLTLLLKGISHHRIVATTYRYDVVPAAAASPPATRVSVSYWERTATGHVRRERESTVAREHWVKLLDCIERDGLQRVSRRRAGIGGPIYAAMAAELRALGMIGEDETMRDVGPDGLRYISTVAGRPHSPRPPQRENIRESGSEPPRTHPEPANQAGIASGEARVVAMEPMVADDGILWAAAYVGAAIVGYFGTWRLCEAIATAAGWM